MKTAMRFIFASRRWLLALIGGGAIGWALPLRADNAIPEAFKPDRYEKMAARSPFTPPTEQPRLAATPPPAPKTSFADRLNVTMLLEDHAVYYATVVDPDNTQHLYLSSDKEDDSTQHMRIESVQWSQASSDQPGGQRTPTITLRKGTEVAQVRYEPGGGAGGMGGGLPAGGGTGGLPRPVIPGNAGGVRIPGGPMIPGSATGGVAVAPPPVPSAAGLPRRTPIRSFPQTTLPPATGGVKGVVLPGGTSTQPGRPVVTNADDDDDDDE